MSSVGHKYMSVQMIRLMVYRRPLHPELFDLQARRIERHGDYEVESWLTDGGHVVRIQHAGESMTETVIDTGDHLPESGLLHALPCIGEKDFELTDDPHYNYVTTLQTETLTENLYSATYREMQEFARETGALSWQWTDGNKPCLSMLDSQKYRNEYHFQSYHLIGSAGFVLRTQSIFELSKDH